MRSHRRFDRRPACPLLSSRPEAEGRSGEIWRRTRRVWRLRQGPSAGPGILPAEGPRPEMELRQIRGQMSRLRFASLDMTGEEVASLDMTDRARVFPNPYQAIPKLRLRLPPGSCRLLACSLRSRQMLRAPVNRL
jgi:hypothetical protein